MRNVSVRANDRESDENGFVGCGSKIDGRVTAGTSVC